MAGTPTAPPSPRERLDVSRLRAFLHRRPEAPPGERCDLCATPVAEGHGHLVDRRDGGVRCACRACTLLMEAGSTRFSVVPSRVLRDPGARIDEALREALGIPVALAFVVRRSQDPAPTAIYPSPTGPTESAVDPAAWQSVVDANPWMGAAADDVEAVLLVGAGTEAPGTETPVTEAPGEEAPGTEALLVPIDRCYALVGVLRSRWRGFDGGEEVRVGVGEVLDGLRRDAVPVDRGSGAAHGGA